MASKNNLIVSEPEDSSSSQPISNSNKVQCSPTTKIDVLSDKELLSMFSRLPLRDLVHSVELVNHRWRWLSLKCCSDQTSLSLLQTPTYRDQLVDITRYWFFTDYTTKVPFGWECIPVNKEVNEMGVKWLETRFPNVTQLVLYCVDHLSLARFVQLIQMYPNLERLILFSSPVQQIQYNQAQFWSALQTLQSLSHVHLPFEFSENPLPNQLEAITRPNIRTIFLSAVCKDNGPTQGDIAKVMLASRTVDRLGLLQVLRPDFGSILNFLNPVNRSSRFGHGIYTSYQQNEIYSAAVTRITIEKAANMQMRFPMNRLDLAIPANVSLLTILINLARLNQLNHIRFTEQRRDDGQPSQFFSGLTSDTYRAQLGQPNHTLPSVHYLHLSQFDLIQPSSIFLYFSLIFPQIHKLYIEDCTVIDESTGNRTSPHWFLTNVRRFGQLRQVYHNSRLVLVMDRDKDGDYGETDKLIRVISREMFIQRP